MAVKDDTTDKWVSKFCELMGWFIGLQKVHGDNLGEAHVKGLAANYLAVKLGIFDETKPKEGLDHFDWDPPYRMNDWQCDFPEQPSCRERMEYRRERMAHWRRRAEERGLFRTAPFSPEVMPDRVHSYCDCLESIIYRVHDWTLHAEVAALARQANDLAVKLGLTHPDWLLAMDLGILPRFVGAEEIHDLPLPWEYDKPPVVLRNPPRVVDESDIPRLRESLKKAQALSSDRAGGDDTAPALQKLKNPVKCGEVAVIVHMRSDNVARMLRSRRYPVVTVGRKNYCEAEDAAVLWPKWKKRWRETENSGEL